MRGVADAEADGVDLDAVLVLNNDHETETSRLDRDRLEAMWRSAFLARAIGVPDAFLIAFDETARYDSPNFGWFRNRYERFVYVDRVVTAPAARGRGLARRLYDDLYGRAAAASHVRICCEVNVDPPNAASDAFHERLGFAEIGRARVGPKTVRYLERAL